MPAELLKISSSQPEAKLVSYAAERIRQGQVLGMPTDTFYGLAADPVNLRAVERIYEIKTRSRHKPLSLLVESVDQATELSRNVPPVFHELAGKYWPGPLTMIVKASSRIPLKVTANTGNVALRVRRKLSLSLLQQLFSLPLSWHEAHHSGATAHRVQQSSHALVGCAYDFEAYAGFALEVLKLRDASQLSPVFSHDSYRVCSALVDDAEVFGRVPMVFMPEDGPGLTAHPDTKVIMPPNLVAPGMLLGLAQRLDWC